MFRMTTLRMVAGALNVAPWKLALVGAAVLSGVLALAVVAAGLFLLILPVIVLVAVVAALFAPRAKARVPATTQPRTPLRSGPQVIEVEYEVLDQRERR